MKRIPVCVSLAASMLLSVTSAFSQLASQNPIARPLAQRTTASLPLFFEANRGQADSRVRFLSRSAAYTLFLTPSEITLMENRTSAGAPRKLARSAEDSETLSPAVVRMQSEAPSCGPRLWREEAPL